MGPSTSTRQLAGAGWASSKLTSPSSQQMNEIMPMIYKRFTEKSAEEWRQIYKALQLMEFLIKNGSERVIDDARSHLSLIKMLRQFHYIDQNGKDQGINVRNRSKELVELLSDVEKIRSERKKARQTRNKYGGVEGGSSGAGFPPGSGSGRYGGFGSESAGYGGGDSSSYGGSTRGVYGDGGGFGGESHDDYDEGGRRGGAERFEEYDEYDDGGAQATPGRRKADAPSKRAAAKKSAPAPKPKEPEVDLFDFGDEPPAPAPYNGTASSSAAILSPPAPAPVAPADDDDFDDFQSASPSVTAPVASQSIPSIPKPNYSSFSTATTSSNTQFAQPAPHSGAQSANFSNIYSTTSPPPSGAATPSFSGLSSPTQQKPSGYQPTGPNYFTSVQAPNQSGTPTGSKVTSPGPSIGGAPAAKKAGGDAFASLLGGIKKNNTPAAKGKTVAELAKEKSQAGLYGANAAPATSAAQPKPSTGSSGMDDLLG